MDRLKRFVGRASKLIAVSTVGFTLVVLGVAVSLPGVPGPGILLVVAGLAVLSTEYNWARRAMAWLKERMRRLKERATGGSSGDDADDDEDDGSGEPAASAAGREVA